VLSTLKRLGSVSYENNQSKFFLLFVLDRSICWRKPIVFTFAYP